MPKSIPKREPKDWNAFEVRRWATESRLFFAHRVSLSFWMRGVTGIVSYLNTRKNKSVDKHSSPLAQG